MKTDASQDHLPTGLRNGGLAEKIIAMARSKSGCSRSENLSQLVKHLVEELDNLRAEKLWLPLQQNGELSLESRYQQALDTEVTEDGAILRVCLAAAEDVPIEAWVVNMAAVKYANHFDDYDKVFGQFSPASLRERVMRIADRRAYHNNRNVTALADWPVFERELDAPQKGQTGLKTGFSMFDHHTGGLGRLTLVGGRTGVGKSMLVQSLAWGALKNGDDVGAIIYTFELSKSIVYGRLLSQASGIPYRQLASGELSKEQRVLRDRAALQLKDGPLKRLQVIQKVPTIPRQPILLSQFQADVNSFLEETGVRQVVIVIDSLQHVGTVPKGSSPPNAPRDEHDVVRTFRQVEEDREWNALAESDLDEDDQRVLLISGLQRWTRRLCTPHGFPVVVVSEVRKPESANQRLTVTDVLGKHHLVYAMDRVLLFEPNGVVSHECEVIPCTLTVAKIGEGLTRGEISFRFHHTHCRFEEVVPSTASPVKSMAKESSSPATKRAKRFAGK